MTEKAPYPLLDFNLINHCADQAFSDGNFLDAIAVFLFWAELDSSLEAGYVGFRLANCYERLGDKVSARYWAARCLFENPNVQEYMDLVDNLGKSDLDHIIDVYRPTYSDRSGLSKKLKELAKLEGRNLWPPS